MLINARLRRIVCAFVPLLLLFDCGPALTDPAAVNITGDWGTSNRVGAVPNIQIMITQDDAGRITGQWSASIPPPMPQCPPQLLPESTGPITGTNTVLEIRLSLVGVGDFQGQWIDQNTLRGAVLSCNALYPVTFTRLTSVQ
jgi:hypothetical protein